MEKRDYIGMFDVLKGILMIMVIFAHHLHMIDVLTGSERLDLIAQNLLRYQVVPIALFFIITGYDFHPARSLKMYIRRQARLLLVPYGISVIAAAMLNLLTGALIRDLYPQRATVIIAGGLFGCVRNMEIFGISAVSVIALWFLPTMFLGGIIFQLIFLIKNEKLRTVLIWLVTITAVSFPDVERMQAPWFIVQSCASLGFLETGRLLKKRKQLYKPLGTVFCITSVVLFIWGSVFSEANVGDNIYRYWMLDYITGIVVSVMLLRAYVISGFAEIEFPGISFLEYIGRYSLYILCVHGVEMLALPWYETGDLRSYTLGTAILIGIVLYVLRILLIVVICEALNRLIQARRNCLRR